MDVKTFSDQLRSRMEERMVSIKKDGEDALAETAKNVQLIRENILELKRFIHRYEFNDPEEEVLFFKEIKPSWSSNYLFHHKVFAIELKTSFCYNGEAIRYCRNQLKKQQRYFSRNSGFYAYLRSGATHLDEQYFRRQNAQTLRCFELDHGFSTAYDKKVARLLAYELLKVYLERKIMMVSGQQHADRPTSKPSWTASKTDLVELIYALHAQGCINHGQAQIKEIVDMFTTLFQLDLNDYYRTYLEIRIRKTGRSKFLDHLKEGLVRRMEESDEKSF